MPDTGAVPVPAAGQVCHALPVLNGLRDRTGRPTVRVRLLAAVLALLLAGPLTVLVLRSLLSAAGLS